MSNVLQFKRNGATVEPAASSLLRRFVPAVRRAVFIVADMARYFRDHIRERWNASWDWQESRTHWRKCRTCHEIHNGWHRCPNRLVGYCLACGRQRLLDAYGRYCSSGHESIVRITFRTKRGV